MVVILVRTIELLVLVSLVLGDLLTQQISQSSFVLILILIGNFNSHFDYQFIQNMNQRFLEDLYINSWYYQISKGL